MTDEYSLAPAAAPLPTVAEDLGHRFVWLHTGTDFYDAMIAIIDAARRAVDVEFYTVAPGGPADRLQDALRRALARGLQVRVMIDALGSDALPAAWLQELQAAGAGVRRFNPRPLLRWSFRDHRKLLVCDEQVALVGGRNVTTDFEGDGIERGWRDLGLQIEGPLARDLARGFTALFDASRLERRTLRPLARFLRSQRVALDGASVIDRKSVV